MSSHSISPTAHYTAEVWYRQGISYEELHTTEGAILYNLLLPLQGIFEWDFGVSLENLLLQRHLLIDYLLDDAIRKERITQVVEVAAGLSPRPLRFAERYKHIQYFDTDLEPMVEKKAALLQNRKLPKNYHRLPVDLLLDLGEHSLFGNLLKKMNTEQGTAVISEGIISYFDRKTAVNIINRISRFLKSFPQGIYITDIHPKNYLQNSFLGVFFKDILGFFVQRKIELPFYSSADVQGILLSEGFTRILEFNPSLCSYVPGIPISEKSPVRIFSAEVL